MDVSAVRRTTADADISEAKNHMLSLNIAVRGKAKKEVEEGRLDNFFAICNRLAVLKASRWTGRCVPETDISIDMQETRQQHSRKHRGTLKAIGEAVRHDITDYDAAPSSIAVKNIAPTPGLAQIMIPETV